MAWEKRRNKWYYYRARKIAGQVVKEYIGCGPIAESAARADRAKRAARESRRQAERAMRGQAEAAKAIVTEMAHECDVILRAALVAAGYHQHDRGQWRRCRGEAS